MAKFKVLRRIDAFVDYVAEVEADTPEQASQLASAKESTIDWEYEGTQKYEARVFVALDSDGWEIAGSELSDF